MATTYDYISSNRRRSFFLIVVFGLLVVGLGWLFGQLTEAGYAGLVIALLIAVVMSLTGYFAGDRIALYTAGARPIRREDNLYLYRIVENLCLTAGLPVPKIYLIDDPSLNAFATGRDPQHASIAVTRGLIEGLANEELEGVLAHELAHVKNYDVRYLTLVVVLVGAVAIMANFFLRFKLFGGRRGGRDNQVGAVLLIVGLLLAILAPLFAQLIQFAVSRRREYLADASGALLTRYPEGLARALEKIGQVNRPLKRPDRATAPLYLVNPFGPLTRRAGGLFSTHPPIESRIAALRQMA